MRCDSVETGTSRRQPWQPLFSAQAASRARGTLGEVHADIQRAACRFTKRQTIRRHCEGAITLPGQDLTLSCSGTTFRRARLVRSVPTGDGMDRDEHPAAPGRGRSVA